MDTNLSDRPVRSATHKDNDPIRFFGGLSFPVERQQIWDYARRHQADALILNRIKEIPERTYENIEEFRKAFAGALENYGNVH